MRGCVNCSLAAISIIAAGILILPRAADASAFTFTLTRMLPAPGPNTFAICYGDDGSLWAHSETAHTIYRLNPVTGAVLQSFPGDGNSIIGLGVKSGIIYGCEEPAIARFSSLNGAALAPLTGPVVAGSRGGTFIGNDLFVAGVLSAFPGDVRIGRVDPTNGALLGSCAPAGITYTQVLGGIASYACYMVPQILGDYSTPWVLRIVDLFSGNLIEDDVLFPATYDVYYVPTASATELFVSRRDLGQIWVYSIGGVVPARSTTWGAIKTLYR